MSHFISIHPLKWVSKTFHASLGPVTFWNLLWPHQLTSVQYLLSGRQLKAQLAPHHTEELVYASTCMCDYVHTVYK